jgi:hypothetical protein
VNAAHAHPCHAGCPNIGNARPDARPKAGNATRTDRTLKSERIVKNLE